MSEKQSKPMYIVSQTPWGTEFVEQLIDGKYVSVLSSVHPGVCQRFAAMGNDFQNLKDLQRHFIKVVLDNDDLALENKKLKELLAKAKEAAK